jgi:hypothetical protein
MRKQKPLFVLYLKTLYKLWNLEVLNFGTQIENKSLRAENARLKAKGACYEQHNRT